MLLRHLPPHLSKEISTMVLSVMDEQNTTAENVKIIYDKQNANDAGLRQGCRERLFMESRCHCHRKAERPSPGAFCEGRRVGDEGLHMQITFQRQLLIK